jgi:hypothetical protein
MSTGVPVEDEHVAALDRRTVLHVLVAAVPDLEAHVAEGRMELVDGLQVHALTPASGLGHGIDGDPVADPAGRVARIEVIRQGWQQEVRRADDQLARDARHGDVKVVESQAAHQRRRRALAVLLLEMRADRLREDRAELMLGDLSIEHPLARLRVGQRLREQVVQQQHLERHGCAAHRRTGRARRRPGSRAARRRTAGLPYCAA